MQEHLGPVMNLARIKFKERDLTFILHVLCVVQTVSFLFMPLKCVNFSQFKSPIFDKRISFKRINDGL